MTAEQRLKRIKEETRIFTEPWNGGRRFNNDVILKIPDFDFLVQLAERALKDKSAAIEEYIKTKTEKLDATSESCGSYDYYESGYISGALQTLSDIEEILVGGQVGEDAES